jgi:hypothetical protein
MAPRGELGSMLSVHRAFVVHLGAGGGPGRRRFSGRVEHLSSGESAHFSSLKGLLAFFAAILDAPASAAPPGLSDCHGTAPPSTIDRTLHPPSPAPGVYHRRRDRSNQPPFHTHTERRIEP